MCFQGNVPLRKDRCAANLFESFDQTLLKVFDQPFFKKVVGFQGNALNRVPQNAKFPYPSKAPERGAIL